MGETVESEMKVETLGGLAMFTMLDKCSYDEGSRVFVQLTRCFRSRKKTRSYKCNINVVFHQ